MGTWNSPLDVWPPEVTNPFGGPSQHPGVDLRAVTPKPCYAIRDGAATCATEAEGGNYIRLDHADGSDSLCAHLSAFLIGNGPVVQGQLIGLTGASGDVTGPHLHLGIRIGGAWTDPIPLLTPYGDGVPPVPVPTPQEDDEMEPIIGVENADGGSLVYVGGKLVDVGSYDDVTALVLGAKAAGGVGFVAKLTGAFVKNWKKALGQTA